MDEYGPKIALDQRVPGSSPIESTIARTIMQTEPRTFRALVQDRGRCCSLLVEFVLVDLIESLFDLGNVIRSEQLLFGIAARGD